MNRFVLHDNPSIAAQMHCDKHVVKMILEEAQMLSTAHRVLDGKQYTDPQANRKIKRWRLNDDRDNILYKATHVNHPCTLWSMQSDKNYAWGFNLFVALLTEYKYRYRRNHACEKLKSYLEQYPTNIKLGILTEFPQAMPMQYKQINPVDGYRTYYIIDKKRFAKWSNRSIPDWFRV